MSLARGTISAEHEASMPDPVTETSQVTVA